MVKIRIKNAFLMVCLLAVFAILALGSAAQLSIEDVDISSPDKSNEVKPNEPLTVSFDIGNEGDSKIEDVSALVYFERNGKKLRDNNEDDLEFDFDLDYIRENKAKNVEFTFNMPFDVEDGQVYIVVIEVEGKNETNRDKFTDDDRSESFTVIRDRHELILYTLDIQPRTISCDRTLNVRYDVRDIGEKDEDANLTIINSLFGINVTENFELSADYDVDNKWDKSHAFEIPSNVALGTYGLTLTLFYDDGRKQSFNTTQITVAECGSGSQDTGGSQSTGQQATETQQTSGQASQGSTVQYTQPSAASSYPAVAPAKKAGLSSTTWALIIAGELVLVLIIVLIVVALRRK